MAKPVGLPKPVNYPSNNYCMFPNSLAQNSHKVQCCGRRMCQASYARIWTPNEPQCSIPTFLQPRSPQLCSKIFLVLQNTENAEEAYKKVVDYIIHLSYYDTVILVILCFLPLLGDSCCYHCMYQPRTAASTYCK